MRDRASAYVIINTLAPQGTVPLLISIQSGIPTQLLKDLETQKFSAYNIAPYLQHCLEKDICVTTNFQELQVTI